jgi:hypothetical protein
MYIEENIFRNPEAGLDMIQVLGKIKREGIYTHVE